MSTVKKLIYIFVIAVLAVVLIVPAYAASATRIGTTSYYYADVSGFGGGSDSNYSSVTLSVLNSFLSGVKSAYPSYTYSTLSLGGGTVIGVYSSSGGRIGYLSTSSGAVYRYVDSGSSGGGSTGGGSSSGSNYSGILGDIYSELHTIANRLYTTTDNGVRDVAQLLYAIREGIYTLSDTLNSINTKLATQTENGNRDVSQLLVTTRNLMFDVVDLLEDIKDGQSLDGGDSDNINNNLVLKFDSLIDVVRNSPTYDDSNVLSKLTDIENSLSNLSIGVSSTSSNNPYVRKIYNALYSGVDGTGADMVDIATSQIGVSEGQPYYTWYGFDTHVEWCACFVSWCADQCGYLDDIVPKFAVVDDGAAWYQSCSLWLNGGDIPSPGDIIFFDWDGDHDPDHVGIVADCSDGLVTTVEGNTGDTPGVVSSRTLSVDSSVIYGYGTPDYPAGGASIYSVLTDISRKLDHIGDFEPVVVGSDDPITGSVYSTYYVPGETTSTPGLNNLCANGNFDDVSYFVTQNCSYTVNDHVAEFTSSVDISNGQDVFFRFPVQFYSGHSYFFCFDVLKTYPGDNLPYGFFYYTDTTSTGFSVTPNVWTNCSSIVVPSKDSASYGKAGFYIELKGYAQPIFAGDKIYFKNLWLIDLTEMYGAGNEPTIEQFRNEYPDISYNVSSLIPVTEEINIDNSTYLSLDVDSQEYVIGDFTAHSDTMSFTVTADTVPDLRVVACLPNGNQIVCNNIIENVNALYEDAGASVTYQVSLPASIPWVDSWNIRLEDSHLTSIGCFNFLNLGASARAELQLLSNISGGGVGAGYDDSVLISKLTDIENALSNLGDNVSVSIEQVSNVDIAIDNSAHDVFYVTDDDGEKSIVDLSGDSIKVVGKLMNFLYQAMFKDALDDAGSGIDGLYDFYLDDSEGVDVWAS